jgi:hypothetical protein
MESVEQPFSFSPTRFPNCQANHVRVLQVGVFKPAVALIKDIKFHPQLSGDSVQFRPIASQIEVTPPYFPYLPAKDIGVWNEFIIWIREPIPRFATKAPSHRQPCGTEHFSQLIGFEFEITGIKRLVEVNNCARWFGPIAQQLERGFLALGQKFLCSVFIF